ncbi:helix-turn-helix domain-containing protein [Alteromonas facilis]|uniref:helix-turn-helix domain-containing protein n=1 Tax=Alteromonas facilis TaxID=2048004 RepID=UPI001F0C71F3|nr:helix-turn-helix domain-containing protein [Alteromonas facilis]
MLALLLAFSAGITGISLIRHHRIWPLTAFLSVLSLHMITNAFELGISSNVLVPTQQSLSLLYGPALYLFVISITRDSLNIRSASVWHLIYIPLLVVINFILPLPVSFTASISIGLFLAYFLAALFRVRKYHQIVEQNLSMLTLRLDWLYAVFALLGSAILLEIIRYSLIYFEAYSLAELVFVAMITVLLLFISSFTFFALREANHLDGVSAEQESLTEDAANQAAEETDNIELANLMLCELQQNAWFTEPSLTIQQFASYLGHPARDVSATINAIFNMNFCEFINRHRIDFIANNLSSNPKANVLKLSYDGGFNSKSSFNQAFKSYTQLTPTQVKGGASLPAILPSLNKHKTVN